MNHGHDRIPHALFSGVARAGEAAHLGFPVHPHMLRHATGFKLANDGHDTRIIQPYLGHKNIQHTVGYTVLAAERGSLLNRARTFCQQVGDTQRLCTVLRGLFGFHAVAGRAQTGLELADELYAIAQPQQNPLLLMEAHNALGSNLFYHGRLECARTHLEQAIAMHEAQQDHPALLPPAVTGRELYSRGYLVWVLSVLSYPDQALQRSREALDLARAP